MKRLLFSRRVSAILAMSFCLPAIPAQEVRSSNAPAARRAETLHEPDKAAPDSKTNNSQSARPQTFSEEESAKLAERAQEPGPEVAGGALSNLHLTYIVIALAAAVLVLVLK